MRIILFIVFYIATYVARLAVGGDIAKTMSGSSMKYIFKQKSGAIGSRVSEIPIDDGTIQMINKRSRQSSLRNRINGFPQSREILNGNLARVKRSLRERKKYAKVARRQNDYADDDDVDEEGTSSNVARFPSWQVSESAVAAISLDSTTNPTAETELIKQSSLSFTRPPSQLENLHYDRPLNEAVPPIAERYLNSPGLFDINASNKNLMLPKTANPKSKIKFDVRSSAFEGSNKTLPPAYRSGVLAGMDSPKSSRPRGFQRRYNEHRRDSSNRYNVRDELPNDHLTGSNKRFLLVPVSKDLYVLKDVRESPRAGVDGMIIPKRHKLLEGDKDNATSAILSFKAHMHHDVNDVGRAYLQRGTANHRSFDHNANYLYPTLESRIPVENASPTENPVPPSYPNFLYPGIAFQTRPNLIDAMSNEMSNEQILSPVPDYDNVSSADSNINTEDGANPYDSPAFLSSSSFDISNYDVPSYSKENVNDGQPNILSAIKLDDAINPFQQDSRDYGSSLEYSEFGVKPTTVDFRDIFDTIDDNACTPVTLENVGLYLANDDKGVYDMSQNLEDDSEFSIERNEDKRITDFIDNISTQYRPAFDASANEANTFFPNTTYVFVNKIEVSNDKGTDENNQRHGIFVDTYSNKKSTRSNDFEYDNRHIDRTPLSSYTTEVDLFLNAKDYVTSAPLSPAAVEWPLKKAQSNVENSRTLLMAIKPLSSELQKLLNAVKLVNQSISDVQSRLCDKKNVVRSAKTEREIAKLINKVDRFGSGLSIKNFNDQSLDKRQIETKAINVAEHDVNFRKKTNGLSLNKLTTPFHKRENSINNSEVQNSRRNFLKRRKLSERKSPRSGDTERRRLSHSRFNRNLKSLTKNYETRAKPIRQLIGLKKMKRTTTPVKRLSHLIENNIPGKNNFANGRFARNHQENNSKLMLLLNNTPSIFSDMSTKKDNPVSFLSSDKRDLMQHNAKRAMSSEMSGSNKERKFPPVDPQFYREATAYLDILRLLDKKPHVEHTTSVVWTTQNVTESLPSLIFITTEFSVSTVTFLPYFTEESTITVSNTIAEKEEASEVTESSLYATVTDFEYGEDYDERNYTGMYGDYEDEENVTSWYNYTKETTTEVKGFIFGEATRSVGIAMTRVDYEMETSTEILRYTTVEYQFVTSAMITATTVVPTITSETSEIVLLTQSPITLSAFTITMPTTPPLFYTTELAIIPIDEAVISITEIATERIAITSAIAILTEVTETPITIPTIENFTTESAILLTPFLEGMTDITLKITIPAATKTSIEETPVLIAETATTEEEIVESTSTTLATEITQTLLVETSMSLYTFLTVSLLTTAETELTTQVTTPIVPVLTPLAITEGPQTTTPISTLVTERTITMSTVSLTNITTKPATTLSENITMYRTVSTTTIARPPTILEKTETLSTSTEVAITTLIPEEEESPVTQIEKTITAEETETTKTPATETAMPIETTTTEISTSTETTTITEILTITETLTTTETPTFTGSSITSEIPTKKISTTIETTIPTEISTPTKILTIFKTPKGTTSAKTLTPIETKTITETSTTTEISTSTEITMITEILTMTETLTTTEAPTSTETSTTSKIPTTKIIPTTIETTATMEISTPTKILTALKTPITTETTSAKTLTPIETKTTTETSTTTEISTSTETTTITEILTMTETLTTTEAPTSTETSTTSKIPTTKKIPTIETTTTAKILTTLKTPIATETTSAKTLTPIETKTTTETSTTTEISTSTETTTITEILTITETLTTTEASTSTETSTTSEIPTTKIIPTTIETTATTETPTPTKILTTLKIPFTEETTSAKTATIIETPPTTETQTIIETLTSTKSPETTEVPMTSTTYITTELFTTEGTTSSPTTKEYFPTSILTTLATISAMETAESTLTSLITPVTTTSIKTTVPMLKSTTTLITNTTLSETPYITISSIFLTTTKGPVTTTSFKAAVITTSSKVTTTPLSLVTSTILTETPSITLSTVLIEETTASSILTTTASSLETLQTTTVLPIPTTVSMTETLLTTSSITTASATVASTTVSTVIAEILESTISPVIYFTVTMPTIAKIPITVPIVMDTGTTAYETTSTLVTSTFLTKTIEGTTPPIMEYEETKGYEEYYYESTKEEIATVTSTAKLTTEERTTTWITAEEITITEETTSLTYLPSSTTSFFMETTTEAIPLVTETITSPTITEATLLIERLTTVTPITMTEEISILSEEATLISVERSTIIETSTTSTRLVPTITATTTSFLEKTVTEIAETTAAMLPTTGRPEYATILEAVVTVTLAPFSESILSILITSETPATTPEVIPILPKTVSEEFTIASTTESPSIIYTTKSSTPLFIETTVQPTVSISAATTEEMPEAETEYYIAKEPLYEEEYEEYEGYDTEIPTDRWYYYDEYETTTKARTTEAEKYTKLPKKKVTSPPFVKGTTMYEVETSEFTSYSTPSETTSIYAVTLTAATSGTPYTYTEKVISTSAVETSASTIVENITMVGAETEFTASTASEEEESTMTGSTFGSTEEYTLPSSTVFEIMTEPLEYLTIPPRYTELERWMQIWPVTSPKFITKLEKITASEGVSTETKVEKLTSVFVSPALTTLTEKETFEVPATVSTASSEIEGTVETGYEVTLPILITEEETVPSVTPFIASETETELVSTTTSKAVEREEKEQLLQRLDDLKQHEREMAEKEERLKEKERQWDREKEKRRKMMQREKEEAKNITIVTGTTEGCITITKNLTVLTTAEIEVTSLGLDTSITTSSLPEITTVSTEATPFSIIEEITSVTYTTERAEETITEESTSTTYAAEEMKDRIIPYTTEETEETVISYATEKSTSVTYSTEETEEVYIMDYITLMPYITTSLVDLYNVGLASVEITTFYTIEGMYTTSYVSETTPSNITEEITSVTPYTIEKMREAITERSTSTTYATEETEETVISYTPEKSTSMAYTTEEIEEEYIKDYVTLTPYVTASIVDLYNISLIPFETTTPHTIEETYTTSYVTLYSEPLFTLSTITSPITSVTDKFVTLAITTFSERFEETNMTSVTTPTWYTTEETYIDVYSKSLFTSPALMFISTTTSSTLAISTTTEIEYDEIESLREKLRKRERELEKREKLLLEREERLARNIIEFEKYMKECEKKETSIIPSEKSTVLTSLSTPVPPIEKTTTKVQVTTQIQGVTEKKENRTTTKMVTSRTKHVPEETVMQETEEIATKRICLNVLENTTIPLDKRRRDIVIKKICLPYFPERDEEKKSVGRLSRKPLALQNTRKIRKPRLNLLSDFRRRRRVIETTCKIGNLQLLHHEWLSNETTKPLQHFKGFTRIYGKMRKFPKKIAAIMDTQKNTSDFQNRTSLYEQRVLDESIFQLTATSMLNSEEHRKRNALFRHDLIPTRKNNFLNNNKASVRKRDVLPIEKNTRFWSKESTASSSNQGITTAIDEEDEYYTVNVLHLSYNNDKQTHEVISAKPDEDELTAILSEPDDDIYVTEFGEGWKITTPYYGIEEEDDLKEEDDELSDEAGKKIEEDDEYVEDMIENYMNYEEHEASTRIHDGRFLGDEGKDKKLTEKERKLLDQAWPTEKSTTYHLGGTRFWELDFVTEPSALSSTTIDRTETIGVSITKTTCFDVVLKNERSAEMQPNYNKRNIRYNGTRKRGSTEKRSASLKNVTRKKLRTKQPSVVAKELKRDSQNLHGSNYYKRSFEEKRTMKFNDFSRVGDEDSMTAKSRKLCGVNANKSKRQVVTHKNAAEKHKKKQLAKSRTLQDINLHSLHDTDNCIMNKKNKDHKMTTTVKQHLQAKTTDDKRNDEKVTHPNIVDRKAKSISPSHERKVHNCFNCICDIVNVINGIRSILDRIRFPLDEIKALNCSEYKEIQNKIVISMDSDMEEAREFPQPHYNTESLKGQKYIKLEELEDNFKSDLELDNDHDVISLPGLNLNLPCNQDGDGITWLSSVSRPSYTWKRTDGIALFGFVAENGDLELRNVNAKDTGNYTCVMTYMSPDSEEPVEATYEVHLQVVTLPRYIVHGENRYHIRSCDESDLDVLVTYLPLKLNSIICEADVCNAYVLTPSCSRSQMTVNVLLVPSHIVKLMAVDPKHCNVFCLKAIQDKLSLILSKNLQIFLGKTLIFRLPHYEQRLVPIVEKSSFARRKRGRTDANAPGEGSSNVGLFSSCPAGYGLRDARCVPCDVGTYSEDGISHCKRCPPGTYQPNHGARVCRTCTNPMMKGCSNMLWNSFSAIMVTLASIGAMVSICLLLLWIICCAKKKFFVKRIAGIAARQSTFEREEQMEQPLIKDASENEDQQWDSEYRIKKKKGKFYINKKRRKQNERRRYDKTHVHEDEWGSHRIKNAPVIYPDSYRSHGDYNNHYPKQSYRKGPRLPECDFDT